MDTYGPPLQTLRTLTNNGVRVAIDDFVTGYSNLACLRKLPVQTLKLAASFIEGLREPDHDDNADEEIISAVIRLAHALGLTVTAEGIETQAQADRLRALNCDTGQSGFTPGRRPRTTSEPCCGPARGCSGQMHSRVVELHQNRYHCTMALNIKDPETERLAAEVAALAAETKTRAINVALRERKARLVVRQAIADRGDRLRRFLTEEAWPQVPHEVLGTPLSKDEREHILGYGPEGV